MTRSQLDMAIAEALGESTHIVRRLGFQAALDQPDDLEPENVQPVVECPFCRRPVPYPGRLENGEWPLAECDRCDLYFEISEDELYTAEV